MGEGDFTHPRKDSAIITLVRKASAPPNLVAFLKIEWEISLT